MSAPLLQLLGIAVLLGAGCSSSRPAAPTSDSPIDYREAIGLDVEALAEGGIAEA